ncbi:type III secretion system cytoplasmic ring protein SctQ [Sinorhizobium americanum]|uniref:Type III secretion system translocation protein, RhcQ n=1 Tax=Sinorhizobium americanum TaxID=194963 RepID=A0A1L3LUM2_9HYPH|nr:type III secretion system cytoplasmic ring protein SctQ [Sinorhizobium americanum]APG93794.1 type III secretion system translocation protein, RhcQ [Sinorhizobium americanum]OAP46261.1 type III secretion protein [Sinorhizobium americanum]
MSSTVQPRISATELRPPAEDASWLPEVNAAHVDLTNLLVGTRAPFRLSLPPNEIGFEPGESTGSLAEPVELAFRIGTSPGRWLVPAAALDAISAAIGVRGRIADLTALQRNILLEVTLAPSLEALEKRLGEPLRLGPPDSTPDFPIKLCWTIDGSEVPLPAELHLSAAAALKLGEAFDTRAGLLNAVTGNLVQPVQIRAGTQQLSLTELASLRPGDVVMCEQSHACDPIAVLGNHLIAALRRSEAGLVFATGWQVLKPSWESSAMSKQETPSSEELEPLADLPVELVFEIGRAEFPLKELARMGEGTVLHASPSLSSPVNILANGRLVGKGELIRIGEGLGVRVVRLSTDG